MSNILNAQQRHNLRMESVDFIKTCPELWGGTRVGMCEHVLLRGKQRHYDCTNYDLLLGDVVDVLNNVNLEDELQDIHMGAKFVVVDEKTGLVIFASFGYDEARKQNTCFIYSIEDLNLVSEIFAEEENEGFYKVKKDGSVETNPAEVRYRDRSKKSQ